MIYHYTRNDHLSAALIGGLSPNSGRRGFCKEHDTYLKVFGAQPIFLTTDPQHVVDTMLGAAMENYTLLEVDCKGLELLPEIWTKLFLPGRVPAWAGKTYICFSNIDPERIRISTERPTYDPGRTCQACGRPL